MVSNSFYKHQRGVSPGEMSYQVNVNPRIVAITNEPGLIAGIPGYVKI
jgi:hypothetical protein